MPRLSERLHSQPQEFKLSKRNMALLKRAGVTSIWFHHTGYAYLKLNGKQEPMHRTLMKLLGHNLDGMEVDHKNGNTLDNRLHNLRVVTKKQNSFNLKLPAHNTSGYKGVSLHKRNQRWVAYIGKCPHVYLGSFGSAIEAARAYNAAAKKRYGKFAKLNQIPK